MRADRSELTARYDFTLDQYQIDAFDALDAGRHVVVAAPTGSGKTVVAEYGVAGALVDGRRAFYTAPIKALSNQKFRDLSEIHGADAIGLLTGDNTVNPSAPVIVMTTEVLRNMIYASSAALHDLGLVVLDEVHFLQDAYRGPVWEEVIIHLPQSVRLVCLSATVSNVGDLADWISTARGPTEAIVEQRRPVPLENRYLAADRTNDRLRLLPVFVDGGVNRDALRLDESAIRYGPGRRRGANGASSKSAGDNRRRLATPGRVEVVRLLETHALLPAIFFIFSRAQCEEAARVCVDAGMRLTSAQERRAIARIIDERLGGLETADLEVLGFRQFAAQLDNGIAAHHAGMVPPMKEVVEACFIEGLVKVVFATETLAVGINMPARSVVIEKLTKFTGDHHERLTPGEYTQLTGRAGRRGIDDRGDAVVLWSPWVRFDEVAQLAGSSSFHLRSAFRPTYNMTANLIRTYSREQAHHLLNLSFAQYQADRDVVRLEARLERRRIARDECRAQAESPFGDIAEYRALREAERGERAARRTSNSRDVVTAMERLRPGAVISVVKGGHRGSAAVIASAHRKGGIRLTLIDKSAERFTVVADDFDVPPFVLGTIAVPPNFSPNRRDYREEVARRVRKARVKPGPGTRGAPARDRSLSSQHPVARDPNLTARLRAAGDAERLTREVAELERRVGGKNQSLARDFDRVLDLLELFGYVDVGSWSLTAAGEMLAKTFHESDLLVTEVVGAGLLDDLGPADVAALVSTVVYEHRSPEAPPAPWFSSKDIRRRWRRIEAISEDLAAQERAAGLGEHRPPDPTFAAVAYAWVAGEGFADLVSDEELTGGDFVRNIRQLIDLLRQLALTAPAAGTRRAAGRAAEAAFRGVVADSTIPAAAVSNPPMSGGAP